MRKKTQEQAISDFKKVHGDKYDYSKVVYVKGGSKVIIICPQHGEFEQTPETHLRGSECHKCGREATGKKLSMNTKEFIEKVKKVHGDKYDYSKVEYFNNQKKITIICKIHGEFEQNASSHLQGLGCKKCGIEKRSREHRLTTKEFIEKAIKYHGDKYDYSKVHYVTWETKVIIICSKHGEFEQAPSNYLSGGGCPRCSVEKRSRERRLTTKELIERSKKVHGDKYDYSKVVYTKGDSKVIIICKVHGEFEKKAGNHHRGSGCPSCAVSGFKPHLPAIVYYLKVETRNQIAYKIGITNLSVEKRFGSPEDREKITTLGTWEYQKGADAYAHEQKVLSDYKQFQYQGDPILSSGNTELFNRDILLLDQRMAA